MAAKPKTAKDHFNHILRGVATEANPVEWKLVKETEGIFGDFDDEDKKGNIEKIIKEINIDDETAQKVIDEAKNLKSVYSHKVGFCELGSFCVKRAKELLEDKKKVDFQKGTKQEPVGEKASEGHVTNSEGMKAKVDEIKSDSTNSTGTEKTESVSKDTKESDNTKDVANSSAENQANLANQGRRRRGKQK